MKKALRLINLGALIMLNTISFAFGQVSQKQNAEQIADQIHFQIISNNAITFNWVGTANQILFGTDSDRKSVV